MDVRAASPIVTSELCSVLAECEELRDELRADDRGKGMRVIRDMARCVDSDLEGLQLLIAGSCSVQGVAHRWLERTGCPSIRQPGQKAMDVVDAEIDDLHPSAPSCLHNLAVGEVAHQVGHVFGEHWGFVAETVVGGLVGPEPHASENPVRDRFTEAGAHAALVGAGELILEGVVPEGILAHRVFVGVDALARGAAAAQSVVREFRDEHFDAAAHERVLSCPDGGCFTPYQSAIAAENVLQVLKGPGAVVHEVHHFLAEQTKHALDACGLTEKNVSEFIGNVERIDAMVEDLPHPIDLP